MTERHPGELELLAYVEDGVADPVVVRDHLAACSKCTEQVRRLEAARAALREAPLLELSPARRDAILRRLPEREPGGQRFPVPLRALAAAAALALIAGALALLV